jgi:hypothetical protein
MEPVVSKPDRKSIRVEWLREPKYALQQKVWIGDDQGIDEATVIYHIARMASLEGEEKGSRVTCAVVQRYALDRFSFKAADGYFDEMEIYPSKEEAERLTRKVAVEFSDEDWRDAIGLAPGDDRASYDEEAELGPCCANISEIRDMLFECAENKGLIVRDVERLQAMLDGHESATKSMCPTLYKILDAIGVTWKEQ